MKSISSIQLIVLFLCCFGICTSYDDFRFSRSIDCINQDTKGICKKWNETTTLYRYSSFVYYCFPADAYVLTRDGPTQMKDLTLQHQIFSMNVESGKNQFTPITAWLHRDTTSLYSYSLIQVQNEPWKFMASKYHNIAFSNQDQTDFKFLKDLNQNDTLISLTNSGKDFRVKSVKEEIEKEGLYSPLTETGTFYLYPDNFTLEQFNSKNVEYPMILVHSLSQISNPTHNLKIASGYVGISHALFGKAQPIHEDQYVNPLLSHFSLFFGEDWVKVDGEKIAHRYTSTSSSRNQERQRRKRKTMATVALQTILSKILL